MTAFIACGEKKEDKGSSLLTQLTMPLKADIGGTIGEGTSMNVLEVVDSNGDTTSIEIGNDRFFGDKDAGDSVVVSYITIDNELISSTIVNMNNFLHTWAMEPEEGVKTKYMELDPKGFVHIYVDRKEDMRYERWQLEDGKLMLFPPADSITSVQTDTLEIVSLSTDSMIVMEGEKVVKLWRYN